MKEYILLGRLKTKLGESSILIVLLVSGLITLVFLPIFSMVFEKSLVKLAMQDISDQLDINTYLIYQHVDLNAFSRQELKITSDLLDSLNDKIKLHHPQVEKISIIGVSLSDHDIQRMRLEVELIMKPTLYRSLYSFNRIHHSRYSVQLPIDGDKL